MQKPTFIVLIKDTQKGIWQGTLLWAEGKKEMHFRSSLELLMLMESVINDKKDKNKRINFAIKKSKTRLKK